MRHNMHNATNVAVGLLILVVTISGCATFDHAHRLGKLDKAVTSQRQEIDALSNRVRALENKRACLCQPSKPCHCAKACACSCDSEAVVDLRRDLDALQDRASDGESKVLKVYAGILQRFKEIEARLPKKVHLSKPPVRRQSRCGAHPPSCRGIAALGVGGEPEGVTGASIVLCATSSPPKCEPWWPGKHFLTAVQDARLAHAKAVQKRIEQRRLLLAFLFGGQAK